MPRTKVSKSSKRTREATNREEKVREFENSLEGYQNSIDETIMVYLTTYENEFEMLLQRTSSDLLKMKVYDVFEMDLNSFTDWNKQKSILNASLHNSTNSTLMKSARAINPNDEGYLTEDSSTGGSIGTATTNAAFLSASTMRSQQIVQQSSRLRTPGPLSSARARRPRRSRSACGDFVPIPGSAVKIKPQLTATGGGQAAAAERSRSKMRTPMASRTKALSADRTNKVESSDSPKSPIAFYRFPKPGEMVLSTCGSPLVSHMVPENFAHLNIPMRNGVISMRPNKLSDVQQHLIQDLDPATVDQLRTLKTNIDKIVSMVDNAGF